MFFVPLSARHPSLSEQHVSLHPRLRSSWLRHSGLSRGHLNDFFCLYVRKAEAVGEEFRMGTTSQSDEIDEIDDRIRRYFPQVYYATKYLVKKTMAHVKTVDTSERKFLKVEATFGKMFISDRDQQAFMSCLSGCLTDRVIEQLEAIDTWEVENKWCFVRDFYYQLNNRTVRTRATHHEHEDSPHLTHAIERGVFSCNLRYAYCSPRHQGCVLDPMVGSTELQHNARQDDFDHYLTRVNIKMEPCIPDEELKDLIVQPSLVRISARRRFISRSKTLNEINWKFEIIYSWQGKTLEEAFHNRNKSQPHMSMECEAIPGQSISFDESNLLLLFSSLLLKMKDFLAATPSHTALQKMNVCNIPIFYPMT